jgi:hypothetical protein
VARWDGTQWNAMGGGPSGNNNGLAIVGTDIYVAGVFTNIQGRAAKNVARWDGAAWQPLAPGEAGEISTTVYCLGASSNTLYAGGDFIRAGNAGALAIAKWDGNLWSALTGPKSQGAWLGPRVVSVAGNEVYIGGSGLLIAGGVKANRIAHWNGSAWDDVDGGIAGGNSDVNAILSYGGNVYVGGNFTSAGGVTAKNVAYWDGGSWHALASGLNSNINALCFHSGQLFAGGSFTRRGDGTGNLPGIARWDGNDWVDVPVILSWRINNVINALVSDGANLYVGGNYFIGWFEPVPPYNGASVDNIGYWDGSNWWPLGTGFTTNVNSLALMGGELYACGSFTNSGPTRTRRIAKWNGSAWSEVGDGISNGTVSSLAASGSALYVGGSFTNISGVNALGRIAKWDGSQWRALGSSVSRILPASWSVSRIAVSGDDVYMVGTFTYAGGRPSAAFAHWNETVSFVPPVIRLLNTGIDGLGRFHFDIGGLVSGSYTVNASTNLTDWESIYTGDASSTNFTDSDSPNLPLRAYRVSVPWP